MANYKNQHYIPRHYLFPWAIVPNPNKKSENLPFILEKKTGKIKQTSTKNLFSESYFYKVEKLTKSDIEQLFNYFYNKISEINVDNTVEDQLIKETINKGFFLCYTAANRPDFNIFIEQYFWPHIESYYKEIDYIINNYKLSDDRNQELIGDLKRYVVFLRMRTLSFRSNLEQQYRQYFKTENWNKYFPYLLVIDSFLNLALLEYNFKLHIIKTSTSLITSDNPVIWDPMYIILLISPNCYLKLVNEQNNKNIRISGLKLNELQYKQANKYLIAAREDDFSINLKLEIRRILYTR